MSATKFQGVYTALITPFKNGEVDYASLKRLVKRQLDDGIDGFVVNGTTAENPTLSREEIRKIFDCVKAEVSGQIPLVIGTGSNSTAATVAFTREATEWGVDGALVVVPYYNKPTQRGLVAHFEAVAKASHKPVIIYNVPGRTVTSFEPETVGKLSRVENIVAIKEATGNMEYFDKVRAASRPDFTFLSGDDGTVVEFCARGGHGTIAVASHFLAAEMKRFIASGDVAGYQEKYGELMKWLYIESNPIGVKAVLHWQGVIDSPELRLPLTALDEKFHKDFQACLKKLSLI